MIALLADLLAKTDALKVSRKHHFEVLELNLEHNIDIFLEKYMNQTCSFRYYGSPDSEGNVENLGQPAI